MIGFGDRQGGYDFSGNAALSGQYDKQVYMTHDGHLKFGVWVGLRRHRHVQQHIQRRAVAPRGRRPRAATA